MRGGRKKLRALYVLAALCLCITAASAIGSAGSVGDPLISLSYIRQVYLPEMTKKIENLTATAFNALFERKSLKAQQASADKIAQMYISALGMSGVSGAAFSEVRLFNGDMIKMQLGTQIVLKSGAAKLSGAATSEFIDINAGTAVKTNTSAVLNRAYLSADGSCTIVSTGNYTSVSVKGGYTLTRAYTAKYTAIADGLKEMGLFKGTGSGYELERQATRIEAVIMLIRLLGEEDAALACSDANPFSDVDAWADRYAAYAYSKGYTKGTSEARFSPSAEVTDEQYFTFVLRTLGYSDSDGDFKWDQASKFAAERGVITSSELAMLKGAAFRRDQVVYVSRNALYAKRKDMQATLADSLIANGAISAASFDAAKKITGFAR